MAQVTLTFTGTGKTRSLENLFNKTAPETMKLRSLSAITDNGAATVMGDVTESANTAAVDVDPADITVTFTDPNSEITYSGTIEITVSGTSTSVGFALTNQAGTELYAFGSSTSRNLEDGDTITINTFNIIQA